MTHPLVKRSRRLGKSLGIDDIPAEVYQHGGEAVLGKPQDLFINYWEKGTLPQDLRDTVDVSLYKNKGEKSDLFELPRHEDSGAVPTPSTRGIQSFSHQHPWHQPKHNGTLHLPG